MVDATHIATNCGNAKAANVVLVGILSQAIGLPAEAVEIAIREIVPAKALEVNLEAFKEGFKILDQTV